jgi:hypothetical protein
MDQPAQAEPGPRPDPQPSDLAPAVPAKVRPAAEDPSSSDAADGATEDCELSDEDYSRYEPL